MKLLNKFHFFINFLINEEIHYNFMQKYFLILYCKDNSKIP